MTPQDNKPFASGTVYAHGGSAIATAGVVTVQRAINDEWRRWIAENLLLGSSRESVLSSMIAQGLPPAESTAEIELALRSPYLKAVERMGNRLKKREWQLASYRKMNRLNPASREIERRHKLSRDAFIRDHYSANRPVIITGMMDDWPALRKWDLDYFAERFGDREVDVQLGRNADGNYEAQRERFRRKMSFSYFIERVRTSGVTNDFYITASNNSINKGALPELWEDIVQIPEYLNGVAPHNGFFWFGPAGTITPFHHDLTNLFMAQVMGRKRVKVSPSWDMPLMRNFFHVYCELDGRGTPPTPQPGLGQPQILECILGPGELLFLPIGYSHWVEALDVSAMLSFTNFAWDNNDYTSFYETYQGV
jgi:Cupin-like domain